MVFANDWMNARESTGVSIESIKIANRIEVKKVAKSSSLIKHSLADHDHGNRVCGRRNRGCRLKDQHRNVCGQPSDRQID